MSAVAVSENGNSLQPIINQVAEQGHARNLHLSSQNRFISVFVPILISYLNLYQQRKHYNQFLIYCIKFIYSIKMELSFWCISFFDALKWSQSLLNMERSKIYQFDEYINLSITSH